MARRPHHATQIMPVVESTQAMPRVPADPGAGTVPRPVASNPLPPSQQRHDEHADLWHPPVTAALAPVAPEPQAVVTEPRHAQADDDCWPLVTAHRAALTQLRTEDPATRPQFSGEASAEHVIELAPPRIDGIWFRIEKDVHGRVVDRDRSLRDWNNWWAAQLAVDPVMHLYSGTASPRTVQFATGGYAEFSNTSTSTSGKRVSR